MKFSALVFLVMLTTTVAQAGDWPQWRGPNFDGSTDETNLPTQWSQTENVAWSIDLPGHSASTPVILGDNVFVSSTDTKNNKLKAICLSRKTGEVKWQHDVATGLTQDERSTFAGPSPATDGEVVVFFYGNGDLVTFDLEGKKLWSRNLGPFAFQWTFSSSPLLYDGKLYMQILQRDTPVQGRGSKHNESYLMALSPKTGKTLWRHVRPSNAVAESLEAFTTPIPYEHDGRTELIIAGGDALTGHDPETGKELWRWGTWNPTRISHWRLVPSPVAGDGVVLACGPKRAPIYAVKCGGEGTLDDDDLAWVSASVEARPVSSDVPTPSFYDGDFFVLSDVRKCLSRVEPATGEIKWTVETPGRAKYEASPTLADGKIYLINHDGEASVLNAEDGKLIHSVKMENDPKQFVRSSVVASHGAAFHSYE